jgi:sugar phosphate isomerase/epimerase
MQGVKPQSLHELETAVLFWAAENPDESLAVLKRLGIRCGQIGLRGDFDLSCAPQWKEALQAVNFTATAVCAAYLGEDYSDIPTVKRTVGFIPPLTRDVREKRTYRVIDFGAAIGAKSISIHIGFVPHDSRDPDYVAVREIVRRVCDYAVKNGQTFALETGQESAPELLAFLRNVNRENLGINFDPANMILYGTGDPIEALDVLGEHVLSVHCKDGDWPPAGQPTALGQEKPLGEGAIGVERFLDKLAQIGYKGPLTIEREGVDPAEWLKDVESSIQLLAKLKQRAAQN